MLKHIQEKQKEKKKKKGGLHSLSPPSARSCALADTQIDTAELQPL